MMMMMMMMMMMAMVMVMVMVMVSGSLEAQKKPERDLGVANGACGEPRESWGEPWGALLGSQLPWTQLESPLCFLKLSWALLGSSGPLVLSGILTR